MKHLLAFCLFLIIVTSVSANRPSVEESKALNVKAFEINLELHDLYKRSAISKNASTEDIKKLNDQLNELRTLHPKIAEAVAAKSLGMDRIILGTQRYRALAWLHAWCTFNHLAYRASLPSSDPILRKRLVSVGDSEKSSLELLISTYAEIAETENNKSNPLQAILREEDQLSHLLAYGEPWLSPEEKKKAGVNHNVYIPSSKDLLGQSADLVVGGKMLIGGKTPRNFLSLWGLVNLEVDTWHNNRLNPENGSTLPASTNAPALGLGDLAGWLLHLSAGPLRDFGSVETQGRFRSRVNKIGLFLRWRQNHTDETELKRFVRRLYDARTKGGESLEAAYGDLLQSARPDEGEFLFDAAYWARYTYLLSIKMPRRSLQRPEQADVIENTWKNLGLGEFYAERPDVSERPGYLRWNQQPANSNITSLLSDLTNATWKFFAFEQNVRKFDSEQFSGINQSVYSNNSDPGKLTALESYSAGLEKNLADLRSSFREFVEPYFTPVAFVPAGAPSPKLDYYQKLFLANPVRLTTADDPYTVRFRASTTITEQERIIQDFATIAGEMRSAMLLYGMVRDAYDQANQTKDSSDVGFLLQRLPSGIPFSSAQIYQLPALSFQDYLDNFDRHIRTLEKGVKLLEAKKDLRAEYKSKRERFNAAQLRLRAARIGTEIIQKAVGISETYRKIADIGAEIEDKGKEIARLENAGWTSSAEANDRRLAQVERLRDLAAAQVDALREVSQQAFEILTGEVQRLEGLKAQLNESVDEKEEEARANAVIGVIKTSVNLICLALVPFTSGGSMSVASTINQGIDIYQQLSKVNWDNFGDAVIGIGEAADSVGRAIETGVDSFGSEEAKKSLAEAKLFLNQKRGNIATATGTTRKLLEAIGKLPNDAIGNIATALSNGYTVSIRQNGKLEFDFGNKKIIFKHEGLKNDLKSFLDAGGMIVNDLRLRNSDLIKLPEISDPRKFRDKLSESLDIIAKQMPPEILSNWEAVGEDVKRQKEEEFKNRLARLKGRVQDIDTSITDLRILGQAIVGGWLVVSDQETTVSILAPPLTTEAAQFKARLVAYQNAIVFTEMNGLVNKLNGRRDEIIAKANTASDSLPALRQLVALIPTYIDQTKADVSDINKKLDDAKSKLEDTTNQVEIAYYDSDATKAFREASDIRLKQADERIRQAALEKARALLQYEMEVLGSEKQDNEVVGATHELRAAEIDFQRTYEASLEAGIDPLADEAGELSKKEKGRRRDYNRFEIIPPFSSPAMTPPSTNSLRSLLAGYEIDSNSDYVPNYDRLAIAQTSDDLIGLLQWLSLVSKPDDDPKPADYFALTVSHAIYDEPKKAAENLREIKAKVHELYVKRANSRMDPKSAEDSTTDNTRITWLVNTPERWSKTFLKNYRIPEAKIAQVIGYIQFRFEHDDGTDNERTLYKSVGPPGNAYYVDTNHIRVYCEKCNNLRFIAIPPVKPVPNLGSMLIGKTGSEIFQNENDIVASPYTAQGKSEIRDKLKLHYKLSLTGALGSDNAREGDWTILILDPTAKTPPQRKQLIDLLDKTVFWFVAGYLQIDPTKKVQ